MPLDSIVEDINQVDESVRSFYKETEHGYMLDVAPRGGFALENVEGLKSALGKERARATDLSNQVRNFEGIDPVEVRSKMDRLAELEAIDPAKQDEKTQAQIKAMQDQLVSRHQAELQEATSVTGKYKSQLEQILVDDRAKDAILKAGGDEKTIAFMLHEVKSKIRVQETENGQFTTVVVDSAGNPRIGDSSGSPMTVAQLVADMKNGPESDLWAAAFPGRNKSGGGRPSDTQGGTPSAKLKKSDMSTSEKSAFIRQNGHQAYAKLKD